METQIKVNRRPPATPQQETRTKRAWPLWLKLAGLVIAVMLICAALYWFVLRPTPIDSSTYQAVQLSSGEVYFGKLEGYGGPTPVLRDVYYYQAQATEDAKSTRSLVKLGDELHRPRDEMLLNATSIIWVQNLSGDGQVMDAIRQLN